MSVNLPSRMSASSSGCVALELILPSGRWVWTSTDMATAAGAGGSDSFANRMLMYSVRGVLSGDFFIWMSIQRKPGKAVAWDRAQPPIPLTPRQSGLAVATCLPVCGLLPLHKDTNPIVPPVAELVHTAG